MRLWSLHPRYLDTRGLVALWREALLAQKVLTNPTRGYRNHPQLERFRAHPSSAHAIASYLHTVRDEATQRGYNFDRTRIHLPHRHTTPIEVTEGQLRYELAHLTAKLKRRAPAAHERLQRITVPDPHPSLVVVPGPIAAWERLDL
ncbi:MAG: pyrimidine dimer DNA glycosylase/endonuclease V [Chloroflexota bacterium]|nr:pyrimidine dimer DNA glycosylase/endonuclease V [Chloroflexota bacterium]